jgi:hypothetical protein
MTPSGIDPVTFRFGARCLNHYVPPIISLHVIILDAVKYSNKCRLNSRNFCLGGGVKLDVNGGQQDQAEIPASMGPFLQNGYTIKVKVTL